MRELPFDNFLARYKRFPTLSECEELELGNFSQDLKTANTLIGCENESIYYDVSHTLNCPVNSGIQRVVRSTAIALAEATANLVLIKFDDMTGQPVRLSESEVDKFYNWEGDRHQPKQSVLKKIKAYILLLVPKFLLKPLVHCYRLLRLLKMGRLKWKHIFKGIDPLESINTLDLRGKRVLLPEVVSEIKRIEMIEVLGTYYRVHFSAVIYDLIPISHPDLCVIGYAFNHYLRLLRVIEKGICISESTKLQVEALLGAVDRRVSNPVTIKRSYLPGEFIGKQIGSNVQLCEGEKIVLMVARLEPRKNIRRILKAISNLLEQGLQFKFVLVGNRGWMDSEILNDLDTMISKGQNVEVHLSVSDSELMAWYQKCYFTVFCSITEGLGLPIIESLLFGKPCLTSNQGSQKELADLLGGCKMVDRFDILEIQEGIQTLLIKPDEYESLRSKIDLVNWPSWSEFAKSLN